MIPSTPYTPLRQFIIVTPLVPNFGCTVYGEVLMDGTVNCWHDEQQTSFAGQFSNLELQENEGFKPISAEHRKD